MKNKHVGGSLDDFLKEEGIYEEVCLRAAKMSLTLKLKALMKEVHISKTAMAKKMHTNRSTLDRLLDPNNLAVELDTMSRAAVALDKQLVLDIR